MSFFSFLLTNSKLTDFFSTIGILAGLYSYLKNNSITIFYPESPTQAYLVEPVRKNVKFSLDDVGSEAMNREIEVLAKYIIEMEMDIGWPEPLKRSADWSAKLAFAFDYLTEMLQSYKQAVIDKKFVSEFALIDVFIESEL